MLAISNGRGNVVRHQTMAISVLSKVAESKLKSNSARNVKTRKPEVKMSRPKLVSETSMPKGKTGARTGGPVKTPREILDFIGRVGGSNFPPVEKLPVKSLRYVSKLQPSAYLVDPSVAKKMGDILTKRVETKEIDVNAPSLELSPGPGLLTSVLLSAVGLPTVTLMEEDESSESFLYERFGRNRVQVVRKDFGDLPRLHHMDKVDGGVRIHSLFSSMKSHTKLQVFGNMPQLSQVNFLMKTLVTGQVFWAEDDVESSKFDVGKVHKVTPDVTLWIVLPSVTYSSLIATPEDGKGKYRANAVLFQLLFNIEELAKFNAKGWLPWHKTKEKADFKPTSMYFLQLSVKKETVAAVGGRDNLVGLWYFIRQHLFSRSRPIIPQLEAWIPGCGARLVRPPYQFSIYDTFATQSPQQILNLYQTFMSWPEFSHSSFLTAVEKFASRVDEDEHREQKSKSSARGRDKV